MDDKGGAPRAALTDEQRHLVRDNIGLVAVHLRRFVPGLEMPRRDREWDDLFQEGCIGLIRAATSYRVERGIPFAAYAFPRIHNAVSRALRRRFSTVRMPDTGSVRRGRPGDAESSIDPRRAKTYALTAALEERAANSGRRHCPSRNHDSEDRAEGDTIGQRLRDKYDRAVRHAARSIGTRQSARGDRDELIRVLTEERLLVPQQESRRALRQIARDTRSSYARVAQCEKRLADMIRRTLEEDPEFRRLESFAREDSMGAEARVDAALEHDLAAASAAEFLQRYRRAERKERAEMFAGLLEMSPAGIEELASARVSSLSATERERLLGGVQSVNRK